MKLIINEIQLKKLSTILIEQSKSNQVATGQQDKTTTTNQQNKLTQKSFNLSDTKNPLNSGGITVDNPKQTINSVYNMLKTNSSQLGLQNADLKLLYNTAKKTNNTNEFLSTVDQTLGKYGIKPNISFTKTDDGLQLKNVGLKFNIPSLTGGIGSVNVGGGKVVAGVRFNF
jgi:uncharacterized phage-associated protein